MRLKSIRLAGFKSFADPTTIQLNPEICAIVGPNGCGKSNIVDGLKWAIGERAASVLRGSTFEDIIFDGSDKRPPNSHASVELRFDNSDGKIGGAYSSYSEISIRREIAVDQASDFYLNGKRCRSRDIQELFFGTGFGTKGYAIIEQGMTDRLVRSKPEELRHYLEEAAGVTSYRERRLETERRIQRTEQNIERVEDSLENLASEIRRLSYQAGATRRFQKLQKEIEEHRIKKVALELRTTKSQIDTLESRLSNAETKRLQLESQLQRSQSMLLDKQEHKREADDLQFQSQADVYEYQSKVSKNESEIDSSNDKIASIQTNISDTQRQICTYQEQLASNKQQLESHARSRQKLELQIVEAETERNTRATTKDESQALVDEIRKGMSDAKEELNNVHNARLTSEHQRSSAEEQIKRATDRIKDLRLEIPDLEAQSKALVTAENLKKAAVITKSQLEDSLEQVESDKNALLNQVAEFETEIEVLKNDLVDRNTVLSAMKAEQSIALGLAEESPKLANWIEAQGMDDNNRVVNTLEIEPGWETAVQMVLGDLARAVEVSDIEKVTSGFEELADSGGLFLTQARSMKTTESDSLLTKVDRREHSVGTHLSEVLIVPNMVEGLQRLTQLDESQSVIMQSGVWMGHGWIRFPGPHTMQKQVFTRTSEIALEQTKIETLEQELLEKQSESDTLQRQRIALEKSQEKLRNDLLIATQELAVRTIEEQSQNGQFESAKHLQERMNQETQELRASIDQGETARKAANENWQDADERLGQLHSTLSSLEKSAADAEEKLAQHQSLLEESTRRWYKVNNDLQLTLNEIKNAETASEVQNRRIEELNLISTRQNRELEEIKSKLPELQTSQSKNLEAFNASKSRLDDRIQEVRKLEDTIRELETTNRELESELNQQNAATNEMNIERATFSNDLTHASDRLSRYEITEIDALELLDEADSPESIELGLSKLDRRLQGLGPINHRAVEEQAEKTKQKEITDGQLRDLESALANLRSSIEKIDREIRSKIQATFDSLNDNLAKVFPRLFGGGRAVLEMTGEGLLDTGVVFRVKPPGKANLPINLLSGGEKALAALSFVFAVFLLNPSPVCILDEVDAPLDQQNVERFVELLGELVDTQFVIITHNPLTMERTKNLLGVTMQEAGVSRVVNVSLETAIGYAQSA